MEGTAATKSILGSALSSPPVWIAWSYRLVEELLLIRKPLLTPRLAPVIVVIRSPLLLNDSLPLLWRFIWFTLTVVILFVFLFIADFLFLDNVFLGLSVRYANPAPSPILVMLLYHCKLMTSSWCNYSLILQQRYHILWVSYPCHNDLRRSRVIERLMHLGRCGQTTSSWNPLMNS